MSVCVATHRAFSQNMNKSRNLREDAAGTAIASCCVAADIGGRLREL
jgi:hypothetical protein